MLAKIMDFLFKPKINKQIGQDIKDSIINVKENHLVFGKYPDQTVASMDVSEISSVAIFGGMGSGKSVGLVGSLFMYLLKNSENSLVFNVLGRYRRASDYRSLKKFDNYIEFDGSEIIIQIMNEIEKRKLLFNEKNIKSINEYEISNEKMPRILVIFDEAYFYEEEHGFHSLLFNHKIKINEFIEKMNEIIKTGGQYGICFIIASQSCLRNDFFHINLLNILYRISYRTREPESIAILGNANASGLERHHFQSNFLDYMVKTSFYSEETMKEVIPFYNKKLKNKNLHLTPDIISKYSI